jgi:hypothetical protein
MLSAVWLIRWSRLNRLVRRARIVSITGSLPVKVSATLLEPGLVGIWRPVLLLPESILQRLSCTEMDAIQAHERGHLVRRDNLTASVHMLTRNLFWFHPLLWWLGTRLIHERERACDESVLAAGRDPENYAATILKVCALYTQSPHFCAASMSGADLKCRVETIMENRRPRRLSIPKRMLVAAFGAAVFIGPGLIALSSTGDATVFDRTSSWELIQQRLNEQRQPRKEIALDPARFDKFVGYYRMGSGEVLFAMRSRMRYFIGVIGQKPDQMYPESENKFFLKGFDPPAQYSFTMDAIGRTTEIVLHQSGEEQHGPRISDADGIAAEAALAQRVASGQPSPGTREALLRQIAGLMAGQPDYSLMAPNLAAGTRQMIGELHAKIAAWGPVTAVEFAGVSKNGMDVYYVIARRKRSKWEIGPLTSDGKISSISFGEEN